MLARQLRNSPSTDDLALVAETMTADLRDHGLGDDDESCRRVLYAMSQWARSRDSWPTPADVIANLPRRENRPAEPPVRPRLEGHVDSRSPEDHIAAMRETLGMARKIAQSKSISD